MFNSVAFRKPKKSKFDLSHDVKMSFNMGPIYPMLCEEVVPGDSFRVQSEVMIRLAPMVAPMMHKVDVYCHYFFVPNRIIWDEWEDFITGGDDGTEAPVFPHYTTGFMDTNGVGSKGQLADYLGIPPIEAGHANSIAISALPFRAYTTIYNEYYRDQDIIAEVDVPKTSGAQTDLNQFVLRTRAWEKDYFTSARPYAQKGTGPVLIPGSAVYKATSTIEQTGGGPSAGNLFLNSSGRLDASIPPTVSTTGRIENIEDINIDVNDLRRSNALQRWLERAARSGSRYTEQLLAYFGVKSSDGRMQRPEYLGGGKQHIMISEVLQTGETGTTPQANMAGHGISVGATNRFQNTFEEHGWVIGLISVLPRTAYQQGIHRKWTRDDKFDYYWPDFANIGEQEVLNKEIYFTGNEDPSETWGYQARYAEYKHAQSRVAGDFRDDLSYYHMGRIFTTLPGLNTNFINASPTTRIFADTSNSDKLWCQIHHNFSALRPMPYYGEPRLVG